MSIKNFARAGGTYVTAPIFYANAEPHIGHAYTAIICDAAHRWNKMKDKHGPSFFSIGTDEHGSKIFRAAVNAGKTPKLFCDEVSTKFSTIFEKLNVEPSHFVRTTDYKHARAVQQFWKTFQKNGHIYKSSYSGYYSIVDECFLPEADITTKNIDGKEVKVVKSTQTAVEWIEEENYMFKLSNFRDEIRKWIEKSNVIRPEKYVPMALSSLDMDEDLSISRSSERLSWGIPVPEDSSQTIYVWLDALVNYLTVTGYPEMKVNWPPTCQVIGKDIIKFHLFYWPAFLLAAGLPLPEKFLVHGHWLVDNVKMSKSLGNVINPNEAIEKYTSEGLRYFLLKHGNPNDDSSFSHSSCIEAINSDIVNNIGNLLNRSTVQKMNTAVRYPEFPIEEMDENVKNEAKTLISMVSTLKRDCEGLYEEMMYYKVIELLMATMKEANRVFQATQPWKEKDRHKLDSIFLITYESLRIVSILMKPITPIFAEFCLSRLSIPKNQRNLEFAEIGRYSGGVLGADKGIFMERLQK